jgi:hypothetical protein
VSYLDPDNVIQANGLGSTHATEASMIEGVDHLLTDGPSYGVVGQAGLQFMAQRYSGDLILQPYLNALSSPSRAPKVELVRN